MRKSFVKDISRIVIKVGTSVLTREGRFEKAAVTRLADQIAVLLKKKIGVTVVSSGAIGSGMTLLGLSERPTSIEGLQAAAAVGQRYLMQCYEEAFSRHGFSTAQVLLTWDDLAAKKRFLNAKRTLHEIQRLGVVPVINENDTVATDEIRFGDNDRLSSLIAILLEADVQVILSDTNGLYEMGKKNEERHRIRIVEDSDEGIFLHVQDKRTKFTVGGMGSKLRSIRMSTSAGIPVFLADGRMKNVLGKLFDASDTGTLFLPASRKARASSGKSWLKHFLSHIRQGRGRS